RPVSWAISPRGCPAGPDPAVRQTAWQTRIPAAGSVDCPGFNDPHGTLTVPSPACGRAASPAVRRAGRNAPQAYAGTWHPSTAQGPRWQRRNQAQTPPSPRTPGGAGTPAPAG